MVYLSITNILYDRLHFQNKSTETTWLGVGKDHGCVCLLFLSLSPKDPKICNLIHFFYIRTLLSK